MLTFVGDFKPDYPEPDLPFDDQSRLVANFECAISDQSVDRAAKAYPIVFDPSVLENLSSYPFALLTIANNHVSDAGDYGFDLLISRLKQNTNFELGGLATEPVKYLEVSGMRVAIISSLEPCRARRAELFKQEDVEAVVLEIRNQADRIFILPHWGKEGEYALFPSPSQRELAKRWIVAGADGVFGHHSHTLQGREFINGKPVYYSIGNFLFDHEESIQYPVTHFSLAITWVPGNELQADEFRVRPITSKKGVVRFFTQKESSTWQLLYSELNELIEKDKKKWRAWVNWFRRVGPVYIPKSDKSWEIRRKENASAWLLCAVWNLLPVTILLRLGCWFGDKQAAMLHKAIIEDLASRLHNSESD
jgi:hypothetical protein